MLTPILNALRPDEYIIVKNKSRKVINFFTEKSFKQRLLDYPAVNVAGRQLIAEMKGFMLNENGIDARPNDLFDMFCHWLVAIKKESPLYAGGESIHTPTGKVSVTIPDDEADAVMTATEAKTQLRESYTIQATLAQIGAKNGISNMDSSE